MVKLIRMECNWCIKSHHTPSKNQQPEHTRALTQTLALATSPPSFAPMPQWKCCDLKVTIFLPTVPLSLSSLMCSSLSSPFLTKAARPALSPPCQVRLAWLWTPCLHILLNTLLVDAGFLHNAWRWVHALEMWALDGGRRRMERKYKKMRGPACVSLCFGGLYRSRCYLAFQY